MNPESNVKSTNIWDYKPQWCQPWSIILTGITIITVSWLIFHRIWLTIVIGLPIVAWWIYFLIIYPQAFAEYIKSQQAKISN
ncbi:MAG: DUF6737 family protein [Cyanobacteria bacterium P01_A01_bin.83]